MNIRSDLAVLEDLEAKAQAFLDAIKAARPVLSRLRSAAGEVRSTGGLLERLAAHELDSPAVGDTAPEETVEVARSGDPA